MHHMGNKGNKLSRNLPCRCFRGFYSSEFGRTWQYEVLLKGRGLVPTTALTVSWTTVDSSLRISLDTVSRLQTFDHS
ncbi:hypothetical protein MPTK1_5g12380 [Marchantia polymorpha subsp. ruderalis]|uniref:Uncharacterized protein n=2 Tax=Marchantia polymorpha TaxID=3197 RepID=A0AAF6BHK9_MARPO|nr:hypothetical protein MARPO_0092s0068 [Marchantia polymorpha]BBN11493.1 hypothetical protein Mp_5g12380 [Marchantia polymorpha subsp. ruderalis]|eukprot:PTQ33107.1 hypothetical protein MARPO_0092s0068 [Marchantia polymorpha]